MESGHKRAVERVAEDGLVLFDIDFECHPLCSADLGRYPGTDGRAHTSVARFPPRVNP
jgi:hypothetical protein